MAQPCERRPQSRSLAGCGWAVSPLRESAVFRPVLHQHRPPSHGVWQGVRLPLKTCRATQRAESFKGNDMLKYAIIFAIVSLIAGALGFTGVAAGAAGIAKILFFIFLAIAVLFIILAVLGVGAARKALR